MTKTPTFIYYNTPYHNTYIISSINGFKVFISQNTTLLHGIDTNLYHCYITYIISYYKHNKNTPTYHRCINTYIYNAL